MSQATERPNPYSQSWFRAKTKITDVTKIYGPKVKVGQDALGNSIFEDILFEDASGRVVYASARHNATNYDALRKQVRQAQNGFLSDDQYRYGKIAAAEVIIEHIKNENVDLSKKVNLFDTLFKNVKKELGVKKLSEVLASVKRLFSSNGTFQWQSDGYRCRGVATIKLLRVRGVDPAIIAEVESLYKGQPSPNVVAQNLSTLIDWEQSEILKLFKKAGAIKYTKIQ